MKILAYAAHALSAYVFGSLMIDAWETGADEARYGR